MIDLSVIKGRLLKVNIKNNLKKKAKDIFDNFIFYRTEYNLVWKCNKNYLPCPVEFRPKTRQNAHKNDHLQG